MFSIYSRFDEGAFCGWDECRGCKPRFGPDEREGAVAWMRDFLVDDNHVAALRSAVHRAGVLLDLTGLTNQQLIDHLGWLISIGRLRVCGRSDLTDTGIAQEVLRAPGTAPTTSFTPLLPVRTANRTPAAPPAAPDPATLPGIDAPTMADALLQAAADGSPFCEVCDSEDRPAGATA